MVRAVGSSVERAKESVRLSGSLGFLQGKREVFKVSNERRKAVARFYGVREGGEYVALNWESLGDVDMVVGSNSLARFLFLFSFYFKRNKISG